MTRPALCAGVLLITLAGHAAWPGEENRPINPLDLRLAARRALEALAIEPPQGEERRQFERLARILDVLTREHIALADVLGHDAPSDAARRAVDRVLAAARKTAANRLAEKADRQAAVRILGRGPDRQDEDLTLLAALPVPQTPLEVQLAAVEAIGRLPHPRVSEILLSHWTQHGPKVHTAVVSVLLWREPWPEVLEDRSANRPELAAALDWARRDLSLRHPSAEVRSRAEQLRRTPAPKPEIRKALDRFQPVHPMPGSEARGRKLFSEATCANCHKLEDIGRHVGPDLSRLVDRSPRSLLVDTIDPNRVVDHRFLEYTALTSNGQQVSGMLCDEATDRIALADANGQPKVVLRNELEELVCNHRSQMPESLEAKLTLQQMADLLAFVAAAPVPEAAVSSQPLETWSRHSERTP